MHYRNENTTKIIYHVSNNANAIGKRGVTQNVEYFLTRKYSIKIDLDYMAFVSLSRVRNQGQYFTR